MSSRNVLIYVLVFLLIGSNSLWWVSVTRPDEVVSVTASDAATSSSPDCHANQVAEDMYRLQLVPLIAAVQTAGTPGADRGAIVGAAQRAAEYPEVALRKMVCMERNGVERAGSIGLVFDGEGRLSGATTVACPY